MIASLPMYERPENRGAHDRFWRAVQKELGYGPEQLSRDVPAWDVWHAPDLILSQTCGMPYRNHLHGRVKLVLTPDYGLSDAPGLYHSVFVARSDDSADLDDYALRVFAFNEVGSQSGWAAPQCHAQERGYTFENTLQTHAHSASALAVASGEADLASLDCVTWDMLKDEDDFSGLKVIGRTAASPGLPYITGLSRSATAVRSAVSSAIDRMQPDDLAALRLKGFVQFQPQDYLRVPNPALP